MDKTSKGKKIFFSIVSFVIGFLASFLFVAPSVLKPVGNFNLGDLEINFMMLGNSSTGDSIYIKAGETDILVDAGSIQSSAKSIKDYITDSNSDLHSYVEDNKLEYVIATHADKDHIAAFVGTKEEKGILKDNELDIETIIEFPRTDKTSSIYNEYRKAVNELKAKGTNVYTALDCYNNQNGASRVIEVAAGIEIEILYNYYYEHESKDENNYSVCFMLRRGEEKYLFTGDLEEKGEEYLVKYNKDILDEVYLFKLGHHGSPTSSTKELLDIIKPKIVVATCVAFSGQYSDNNDNTFPATAVVNRLAALKTVEHFYVPCVTSDNKNGYEPVNGHIVVKANSNGTNIECSESNEDFFNFEIFKKYRSWNVN